MEQNEELNFRVQINFIKEANIVIIAPHGGGIEPGTSELAIAIAGEELSFAVFEGLIKILLSSSWILISV